MVSNFWRYKSFYLQKFRMLDDYHEEFRRTAKSAAVLFMKPFSPSFERTFSDAFNVSPEPISESVFMHEMKHQSATFFEMLSFLNAMHYRDYNAINEALRI